MGVLDAMNDMLLHKTAAAREAEKDGVILTDATYKEYEKKAKEKK